jgi:hypothetical protein
MQQKRVLIISSVSDIHARAVAYAIRAKGHLCEEVYGGDFPTLTAISLRASNHNGASWRLSRESDLGPDIEGTSFDSIWLRHREPPTLPLSMHPGDREVAIRQCDRAFSELVAALHSSRVFWVNPFERENVSSLKAYQLREAERAGLTIPETLVSNNPEEIKEFIAHCGGVAIHKLLYAAVWKPREGDQLLASFTSPVSCSDLPADATLRLCPGIFQPLLKKRFEVRVACFGNYLVSLQIDSQSDERARMDWRAGQWWVDMKPYNLPEGIAAGIRRFLGSTGLAHASLDFIVDDDGEHIFLEANTKGQFLWMEERAGLPMLDIFSEYLIAGERDFDAKSIGTPITWSQFKSAWEGGLKQVIERHAPASSMLIVPDYI